MTVWKHQRGGWYLALRLGGGIRERYYLGRVSKAAAGYVDARVVELQRAALLNAPLSLETQAWLAGLRGPLRTWLERLALAPPVAEKRQLTLSEWCDEYLASRSDYSTLTIKGWRTAKKHMESAFPTAKMNEINPFMAKQFARDLAGRASSEHASKIVERVNQLFSAAIESGLLENNPFSAVKISGKRDKSRDFYLDQASSEAVLAACPHAHARALFALARWCGLRVPHEPLALKWSDVDFALERIRVADDTKTGFRMLPLFPLALAALQQLRAATPADQEFVFDRARRSAATTWRDWVLEAITAAGLREWPKLFHNLRASCRTDLEDRFASHVCDAWLGHSSRVARDHYLMVTPQDWEKAKQA